MPESVALPPWAVALLALLVFALCAWLTLRVRRWWKRLLLLRRMRHARRGEHDARAWLESHGFRIVEQQATRTAFLIVDGAELQFTVRADYLVERGGLRGVVEVKTGAVADPANRGTRRQILEYAWVYDVDVVYLFDADEGRLVEIQVPAR